MKAAAGGLAKVVKVELRRSGEIDMEMIDVVMDCRLPGNPTKVFGAPAGGRIEPSRSAGRNRLTRSPRAVDPG